MDQSVDLFRRSSSFILLALASIAGAFNVSSAHAQDVPVIDKPLIAVEVRGARGSIYDPAKLVAVRLDGITRDLPLYYSGIRFDTTSDWLQRLEAVIQNKSSKTITGGIVSLSCPAAGQAPRDHHFDDDFYFGQTPERAFSAPSKSHRDLKAPVSVMPASEFVFALKDDNNWRVPPRIIQPDTVQTACTIYLGMLYFSDETRWTGDEFWKPDPKSDHGCLKTTPQEFGMNPPAP